VQQQEQHGCAEELWWMQHGLAWTVAWHMLHRQQQIERLHEIKLPQACQLLSGGANDL
jgi:hypothetical protein